MFCIGSSMMLNFVRRQITHAPKLGARCMSSVDSDWLVEDFSVQNEPVLNYLKGSQERIDLDSCLEKMSSTVEEIPIVIGDKEYTTDNVHLQKMPHRHNVAIARYFHATPELLQLAVKTAVDAQKDWEQEPIAKKLKVWDCAANLMSSKYRMDLVAATMLGQSKTVIQAEIDAAAELIDFFRFNAYHLKEILKYKPISEDPSITLNSMRYRGLEGFVAAISPFNFTAIGGNLAYTPALMGNGVVWKPSDTAILSNYIVFKILREAGLPAGVVNFVPSDGPQFGDTVTSSPHLSAINFTGSVGTFNYLWKKVGDNIEKYKTYPRLIGECGGKNYHLVHPSADITTVAVATIKSAFEYCGQKCSACSRLYVPDNLWPQLKDILLSIRSELKMGDPTSYDTFMGAVIDEKAFNRLSEAIEKAKGSSFASVLGGGEQYKRCGYFIEPTIIQTKYPYNDLMSTELFGPVLSVYVYKAHKLDSLMKIIGEVSPYALTGSVFAEDKEFLKRAVNELKMTAGNFYINDKSTGSVVGQQPFGGARKSGTNDKAGGPHYVLRFASPQSIKETFIQQHVWKYPYMED